MTTAMTLVGGAQILPLGPQRFSDEQKRLILDTCCGGASAADAAVLVAIAEARGLNPILGECYFVERWDNAKGRKVWSVQASIDSLRIKAEETGDYGGQGAASYEFSDDGLLTCAKVPVYRKSVPERPFAVGVAYWDEFVQTTKDGKPTRFWSQMPRNQLAKCAEAAALRKAFPKVLGRLYIPEEMQQASSGEKAEATASPATAPQLTETAEPKEIVNTPSFRYFSAIIRKSANAADMAAAAHEIKSAFDSGALNAKQREKLKETYAKQQAKLVAAEEAGVSPDGYDANEAEAEAAAAAHD